jgi:hypothetical protein
MNKQQALITLMQGKYAEIRDIETQYHIFGEMGDYRVRIEHYHDAVRALGSIDDDGLSRHSRLSAEHLAHDVEMLRLITAKPLHMGRGGQHFSVSDAVGFVQPPTESARPDSSIKRRLSQCYKDYTVLFIAIMVEKLEDNIAARTEENNVLSQDCYRLEQMLANLAQGSIPLAAVMQTADMVEHDGLRHHLLQLLGRGEPTREDIIHATHILQQARTRINQEKKELDALGMRFVSSQLMVYEEAKDMVKSLAGQGINIVGKHTESALQHQPQTNKERGI